jgi:hypothetical protein
MPSTENVDDRHLAVLRTQGMSDDLEAKQARPSHLLNMDKTILQCFHERGRMGVYNFTKVAVIPTFASRKHTPALENELQSFEWKRGS